MIGPYWQQEEQQNYEIGHQTKTTWKKRAGTTKKKIDILVAGVTGFLT